MLSYSYIPHIATIGFLLVIVAVAIYIIVIRLKDRENDDNFEKQLAFTINPQNDIAKEKSWLSEKLMILPNKMIEADLVDSDEDIEDVQKKMILIGALLFTITLFFSRNVIIGLLPILVAFAGTMGFATFKISGKENLMDEQIPSFIAIFKANIQANQHPQNAMISAIDGTAMPLHGELIYARDIMEAGDFKPGITALRTSTGNETLRQMASCIELASESGSNIEDQIVIIEDIIEDKQSLQRKKALGVNENKPLFIVAALIIPVIFIGTYFMNEMYRDFWFKSTLSWMILIGVTIVMSISTFVTYKVIKAVELE